MLGTTTAILAIDFPSIFERNHSKSEEFGISVMDSGVALITILAGISSRKARPWHQKTLKMNILEELYLTMGVSIVPIICGFVRITLTSINDYQEHPSEWGIHWNFYTTISLVSVITVFLRDPRYAMPLAFVSMIAYEMAI
jgi:glucosaminylphosphatidylinositol acyltransferase